MSLLDRILPTPAAPTAPTFSVLAGGVALPATLEVISLVTDRAVDRIPTATLVLRDGSLSEQTFPASESEAFKPGNTIAIHLGYRGDNVPVFSGEVIGQRLKVRPRQSLLVVTLKHLAYRMTLLRRMREFFDTSDGEAIASLFDEAGLASEVDGGAPSQPDLVQHGCTDWDFAITRAQANGWVTIVGDEGVMVASPELSKATAALAYGGNLLSFDGEWDQRGHFAEYQAVSIDTETAERVAETEVAEMTFGDDYAPDVLAEAHGASPHTYRYGAPVAAAELAERAVAGVTQSSLSRVRGVAEVVGTTALAVGDTVMLSGLGAALVGAAYVSGIRQEMNERGWTTFVQLGLEEERFTDRHDISAPPAAGAMPAVSGLQLGRVVALADDPRGEERIRVVLPALDADGEGRWAHLATLTAGAEAGTVFRPSLDELVVVGFLDDDPRYPVILGSLHGSRHAAHLPPEEENARSGIRTVGGHELRFDDENQLLELSGPGGEKIALDGNGGSIRLSDQHGNEIVMDGGGITLKSSGKLSLEAATKLDASAGTDCTLEASAGLTATGGASAEFSSSGVTQVKGSLIQLN